jgi:hypothetical protein
LTYFAILYKIYRQWDDFSPIFVVAAVDLTPSKTLLLRQEAGRRTQGEFNMQQQHPIPVGRQTEATCGDTIEALLKLATQEAGADGYGLYELDQAEGQLLLTYWYGLPPWACKVSEHFAAVLSFPLNGRAGLAGVLDFGFLTAQPKEPARHEILRRCAGSIQRLLISAERAEGCLRMAARLVEFGDADRGVQDERSRARSARAGSPGGRVDSGFVEAHR